MSNKNKSKQSSTKRHNLEEVKKKIVKNAIAKVEVVGEKDPESPQGTAKPTTAPNPDPVQKQAEVPAPRSKIEESPWSEWIWDEVSGRWYRAKLGPDSSFLLSCV